MSYTQQDLARDLEEDFRRARNNVTQKQKLNELMDKYGETREEIESKSTMEDWMRFKMANGDELLDTVRTERAAERLRRRNAATAMYNGAMSHAPRIGNIKSGLANLGYYRGDIDDLETPGFKNAMRHFATDYGIKTGDYNAQLDNMDRNLQNIPSKARLDFDGSRLRFIRDGKMVLNLDAMSGQPEYQNSKYQNVRNLGPLPEGRYRVRQNQIQDIDPLQSTLGIAGKIFNRSVGEFPGGHFSWGMTRVWLEPFDDNTMYGRDKFSIHGGASMGSAGCIDIPRQTEEFFDEMRKYKRDLILNVHYDTDKLR